MKNEGTRVVITLYSYILRHQPGYKNKMILVILNRH